MQVLTNRSSPYLLLPIFLFSVCGIIFTSLLSFYWLDDFWKINFIEEEGFWGTIEWFYFNWDGRAISPIYLGRNLMLMLIPYDFSFVPSILSLFSIYLTSIFILKIIGGDRIKLNSIMSIVNSLVFFCFLWLSFSAHLSRSVYWLTGSFYNYANLGLILFFFLVFTRHNYGFFDYILILMIGLSGINISIVMIAAVLLMFYFDLLEVPKIDFFKLLSVLALSFFLVFIAPGNFKRGATEFEFSIIALLGNYFAVLKEGVLMSKWVFITALLAFFFEFSVSSRSYAFKISILFIFLALLYLSPFSFLDSGAPKHTMITFQTLLFISLLFLIQGLKSRFHLNYLYLKFVTLFLFGIFFIIILFEQIRFGKEIKSKISSRYEFFETKRNSDDTVFVNIIQVQDENFINRFWDFDQYPVGSSDRYLEEYFELVKVGKTN